MAWTLYRYILRELLKIMAVTLAVLITLLSFAAAIRPISDGLLSPTALGRFVFYTAPTMLGFALPFAGAFASTLVFIRMAQDNEVLACSAGGLSYRRILTPVIMLGVVLTLTLLLLSNTIVPRFYRAATSIIKADVISVLVAQLNQRKPFTGIDGYVLYADDATVYEPSQVPGLDQRQTAAQIDKVVELHGVAVGELDQGLPVRDVTAERAVVWVYHWPGQDDSNLSIELERSVSFDPASQDYAQVGQTSVGRLAIPNPLDDEIKFFSGAQLERMHEEPERYDRVRGAMDELTTALATERLYQAVTANLDGAVFEGPIPGDRYVFLAPALPRRGEVLTFKGHERNPIVVERFTELSMQADRHYRADTARISVHTSPFSGELVIDIELENVRVDPGDTRQALLRFRDLTWPEPIFSAESATPGYEELRDLATSADYARSEPVQLARDKLREEFVLLDRRIRAQRHYRAASATSCALLLALGAVLSIHLCRQLPLVVFFWTFVLAIVTIILVSTGENLTSDARFPAFAGMGLMWAGNVVLALVLGTVYCKVARH